MMPSTLTVFSPSPCNCLARSSDSFDVVSSRNCAAPVKDGALDAFGVEGSLNRLVSLALENVLQAKHVGSVSVLGYADECSRFCT